MFSGAVSRWYKDYRWPGWQREVRVLPGDAAYSIQPFPFAAGEPLAKRDRRPIPVVQLCRMYLQIADQVRDLPPGTPIQIVETK